MSSATITGRLSRTGGPPTTWQHPLSFELVTLVLSSEIDDLVFYAPLLQLLIELGGCRACGAKQSPEEAWDERVAAVLAGLASAYVLAGGLDDGHALFSRRHAEDTGDVAVLASRSFLSAGALARAVSWLDAAIERAATLGQLDLEEVTVSGGRTH